MVKEVKLGITTMNAGEGMPGSCLKTLLFRHADMFRTIIVVDGERTDEAEQYYDTFDNIKVIWNSWTGSLRQQYDLMLKEFEQGDWWLMLDDDELPLPQLCNLVTQMQSNLDNDNHALYKIVRDSYEQVNTVLTPRVTYFTESDKTYFAGEYFPDEELNQECTAGPRANIFYVSEDLKMMSSPAGRHAVPYYNHGTRIYAAGAPHIHLKAPEQYVYNDCVKAIQDHDIKDVNIEKEYHKVLKDSNITNGQDFITITEQGEVSQSFKDFCLKYVHHGAPEGRLFIWYYNILHPKENPIPEIDWTASLKKVLNNNWRRIYLENKNKWALEKDTSDHRFVSIPEHVSFYHRADGKIEL